MTLIKLLGADILFIFKTGEFYIKLSPLKVSIQCGTKTSTDASGFGREGPQP